MSDAYTWNIAESEIMEILKHKHPPMETQIPL
jgi:hypothetical protein